MQRARGLGTSPAGRPRAHFWGWNGDPDTNPHHTIYRHDDIIGKISLSKEDITADPRGKCRCGPQPLGRGLGAGLRGCAQAGLRGTEEPRDHIIFCRKLFLSVVVHGPHEALLSATGSVLGDLQIRERGARAIAQWEGSH